MSSMSANTNVNANANDEFWQVVHQLKLLMEIQEFRNFARGCLERLYAVAEVSAFPNPCSALLTSFVNAVHSNDSLRTTRGR